MGKRKDLGKDGMGIQKTMRFTDYLGDGMGQLPLNVITSLVAQLTYFYTEKVGLAAGVVATMLLLAKVADACTDLIMGKIMDKSNSPKGKCRPWFIRMLIPAMAIIILLFTVPHASSGLQYAYVLITNILITAIVYTAIAIPYNSLMAIRTESSEERGKMGIARTVFGYVIGMVIAIMLIPITNMLGGTQAAWVKIAVIFSLLSGLCLLVLYKTTRETKAQEETEAGDVENAEDDVPFVEEIKMLFKNKYWVIMLVANLLMNISYGLSASGGAYYAKYILGNDNLVGLLGAVGIIPTLVGFIAVGPMMKKFGMAKTCAIGCTIGAIACIVRVFTPYSLVTCLAGGCFTTFANIPIMCIGGALVNNCVEYNEWKFGKRMVGMSNSASSFGMKIGSGIGGSLIGWLLAVAGYQSAAATQPGSVNIAIFAFSIYIPLVLFVAMAILFKKYNLEEIYPRIMADLTERRKAKKHGEQI